MKEYNPLRILGANGWDWRCYRNDEYSADENEEYECFTMWIHGGYKTLIRACVSEYPEHLCIDGHYGVLWLEACEYENDPPHSENDLYDMIYAIEKAEENLLMIGMPFTPDYKFHGNRANRKRRNDKLRRIYGLDEKEREDNEKRD